MFDRVAQSRRGVSSQSVLARAAAPVVMEACEGRWMLSASATAVVAGGVLTVLGTRQKDEIVIALNTLDTTKLDVTRNGDLVGQFDVSSVDHILVNSGQGNDRITIDSTLNLPSTLMGGEGKDTLNGCMGDDLLEGDNGKDALDGGDGNDEMYGGRSNDNLFGGAGDDNMSGGKSSDSVNGGGGNDTMDGGDGDDSMTGGDGTDHIEGGHGHDSLKGDDGADELFGGDDGDDFFAGDDDSEKKDQTSDDDDNPDGDVLPLG